MAEVKKIGMVIKTLDYDDYDQIVTVLTSNELVAFIALGVRKITSKNRVAIQLGNIVEVEIFAARLRGKLSKLKRATMVKQAPIKETDTALVLLETIKYLSKVQEPKPELLNGIFEAFEFLGGEYNSHFKTYIVYKLLSTIGLKMNIGGCVECGRHDRINGFEFYKGGYTCILHSKHERPLHFLKAIQAIETSFREYMRVEHATNSHIFKELDAFLNANTW